MSARVVYVCSLLLVLSSSWAADLDDIVNAFQRRGPGPAGYYGPVGVEDFELGGLSGDVQLPPPKPTIVRNGYSRVVVDKAKATTAPPPPPAMYMKFPMGQKNGQFNLAGFMANVPPSLMRTTTAAAAFATTPTSTTAAPTEFLYKPVPVGENLTVVDPPHQHTPDDHPVFADTHDPWWRPFEEYDDVIVSKIDPELMYHTTLSVNQQQTIPNRRIGTFNPQPPTTNRPQFGESSIFSSPFHIFSSFFNSFTDSTELDDRPQFPNRVPPTRKHTMLNNRNPLPHLPFPQTPPQPQLPTRRINTLDNAIHKISAVTRPLVLPQHTTPRPFQRRPTRRPVRPLQIHTRPGPQRGPGEEEALQKLGSEHHEVILNRPPKLVPVKKTYIQRPQLPNPPPTPPTPPQSLPTRDPQGTLPTPSTRPPMIVKQPFRRRPVTQRRLPTGRPPYLIPPNVPYLPELTEKENKEVVHYTTIEINRTHPYSTIPVDYYQRTTPSSVEQLGALGKFPRPENLTKEHSGIPDVVGQFPLPFNDTEKEDVVENQHSDIGSILKNLQQTGVAGAEDVGNKEKFLNVADMVAAGPPTMNQTSSESRVSVTKVAAVDESSGSHQLEGETVTTPTSVKLPKQTAEDMWKNFDGFYGMSPAVREKVKKTSSSPVDRKDSRDEFRSSPSPEIRIKSQSPAEPGRPLKPILPSAIPPYLRPILSPSSTRKPPSFVYVETHSLSDKEVTAEQDDEEEEEKEKTDGNMDTNNLAYILIGTCCGLSVLCLSVVILTMRCKSKSHAPSSNRESRSRSRASENLSSFHQQQQQQEASTHKLGSWFTGRHTIGSGKLRENMALPTSFKSNISSLGLRSSRQMTERSSSLRDLLSSERRSGAAVGDDWVGSSESEEYSGDTPKFTDVKYRSFLHGSYAINSCEEKPGTSKEDIKGLSYQSGSSSWKNGGLGQKSKSFSGSSSVRDPEVNMESEVTLVSVSQRQSPVTGADYLDRRGADQLIFWSDNNDRLI